MVHYPAKPETILFRPAARAAQACFQTRLLTSAFQYTDTALTWWN